MDRCPVCGELLTVSTPEGVDDDCIEVKCRYCGESWIEDGLSNESALPEDEQLETSSEIARLKDQLLLEREDNAIFRKAIWMTAGDREAEFVDDNATIFNQVDRKIAEQNETLHRYEMALVTIRDLWQENQTELGNFLQQVISKAFNSKRSL